MYLAKGRYDSAVVPFSGGKTVLSPAEFAGNLATAATSMAGLLLVFIGATNTSFKGYDTASQRAVAPKFKLRGLLALGGFLLALVAAVLSLVGRWNDGVSYVEGAVVCLILAFLIASIAAIITVLDIRAP